MVGKRLHSSSFLFISSLFVLSIAISYILVKLQEAYYCYGYSDCKFWSSFPIFFIINSILIFSLSCYQKLIKRIGKSTSKWKNIHTLCIPFLFVFYFLGLQASFWEYAKVSKNILEVSSSSVTYLFPFIQKNILTIPFTDINKVLISWRLGQSATNCRSIEYLILNDGRRLLVSDFGTWGQVRLINYLIEKQNIPYENTTEGLLIQCP